MYQKTSLLVPDLDISSGGAVMIKITLDQMFCLTTEVVTALLDFLEQFGKTGLAKIKGKNGPLRAKQIVIVATRLADVNELPNKTVLWVLQGMVLSTVERFRSPFKLLLDQECVDDIGWQVGLASQCDANLMRIKETCTMAASSYESLSLANE